VAPFRRVVDVRRVSGPAGGSSRGAAALFHVIFERAYAQHSSFFAAPVSPKDSAGGRKLLLRYPRGCSKLAATVFSTVAETHFIT